MAVPRTSAPALSVEQHTTAEYRNWLSLGHALITVLCQGLRQFIKRETETFYASVAAAAAGPCTCVFVAGRRPNQYHDMSICAWANILQRYHNGNRPNWKQSDSTKWTDPNMGPWEITKLFLPDLGGQLLASEQDMDVTGILNLMYWCDHFRPISQALIKDVRDIRNQKWAHVKKLELTEADKATSFAKIENLLQDPHLTHDLGAQKALREIQTLKCVSDLNNFQAQVLDQYKSIIERDILGLRSDLRKESKRNQRLRNQLDRKMSNLQKLLVSVNNKIKAEKARKNPFRKGALSICSNLNKCTRAVKNLLMPWLMILSLCSFITMLDPKSYKDGK